MQLTVQIEGGEQALKALRTLEPAVAREVGRDITKAGKTLAAAIQKAAPEKPPVSGWTGTGRWPAWTPISATSARRGLNVIVSTSSAGPTAHMAEFIGNATSITSSDGQRLSDMFNRRLGKTVGAGRRKSPGRLGVKIIGDQWASIKQQVQDAVDRAVAEVNRRMP